MAVAQAFAVQRHGHERPTAVERNFQSRICECLAGESSERTRKMDFPAIFQTVNHIERPLVARHRWPGKFKGEFQLATIWTFEGVIDFPLKHFTALFAEGRGQTR